MVKADMQSSKASKIKQNSNSKPSRKNRYYHNTFKPGGYVHLVEEGNDFFGQITSVEEDGLFLDIPDNPDDCYFYDKEFVLQNVRPVSDLHIEILKRYTATLNPVRKLMIESLNISMDIIKKNGFDPKNLEQMKETIVPDLLNETQWIHWKRRVENLLHIPQSSSELHQHQSTDNLNLLIRPQDFIIRVQTFHCSNKNHTLIPIQAELLTKSFDGRSLSSIIIPAGYCKECKHFYILSSVFMQKSLFIKSALCDIVPEHDLHTYLSKQRVDTGNWAQESIMKKCGYTVSSMRGLNDHERSILLDQIIKYKILSQKEVESFLNWLIHMNSTNPTRKEAISKWKNDLEYISGQSKGPIIPIKKIVLR
ncbi:MAG: hypothetical protein WCR13_07245 [Sphaerochaeta sp.]